jgi:hypothetical protein
MRFCPFKYAGWIASSMKDLPTCLRDCDLADCELFDTERRTCGLKVKQ